MSFILIYIQNFFMSHFKIFFTTHFQIFSLTESYASLLKEILMFQICFNRTFHLGCITFQVHENIFFSIELYFKSDHLMRSWNCLKGQKTSMWLTLNHACSCEYDCLNMAYLDHTPCTNSSGNSFLRLCCMTTQPLIVK